MFTANSMQNKTHEVVRLLMNVLVTTRYCDCFCSSRQLEKFEYGVSVSQGVIYFVSRCAYTAKGPFLRNFSF